MPQSTPLTLEDLEALPPSYLLKPGEVAAVLRVDPKTVSRWAKSGRLAARRTTGQHRRFTVADVLATLKGEPIHDDTDTTEDP